MLACNARSVFGFKNQIVVTKYIQKSYTDHEKQLHSSWQTINWKTVIRALALWQSKFTTNIVKKVLTISFYEIPPII